MSNKPFQFKQFSIQQDKTAMKVGTDGVLLGAWAEVRLEVLSVLDIGAGTGLIALQIAQKSNAELIDAIELNDNAYEQTVENFEQSDWGDRLFCYHASLQEFVDEIEEEYDLIISNPPFYTSTFKELEENRAMARHTESLNYNELLEGTSKLLTQNGSCAFIIPFSEEENFIKIASENKLFPNRITRVRGTQNSKIKRSLLQCSFMENKTIINDLVIEIERHKYTQDYIDLVQDFYLKM